MKTLNTAPAITLESFNKTRTGRFSVSFREDGKLRRKSFRTMRLLEIWLRGVVRLGNYYANSATQSIADDVAAGRVVTLTAG